MGLNKNFEKNLVVVPARFYSSRLPGKVMADIGGEPMLKRVLDNCSKALSNDSIFVCTDNNNVFKEVQKWGYKVLLTSKNCSSGSERIASIIKDLIADAWSIKAGIFDSKLGKQIIDKTFVINVQGDLPFIDPKCLNNMILEANKLNNKFDVITPIYRIKNKGDLEDPNIVKVLVGHRNKVIYFSRSPLPYIRDQHIDNWLKFHNYWGHVGIYGYKANVLLNWDSLIASKLEDLEKLEQLKLLDNGLVFKTFKVTGNFLSVDTLDQLEKARFHLRTKKEIN